MEFRFRVFWITFRGPLECISSWALDMIDTTMINCIVPPPWQTGACYVSPVWNRSSNSQGGRTGGGKGVCPGKCVSRNISGGRAGRAKKRG